ncbi:hypothetical protein D3C76_1555290 [compost metagenome]
MRHFMTGNDADADVAQHRFSDRLAAADLQHRTDLDPGLFQHLLGQFACRRALLTNQQTMPGQCRQRQRFTAGQWMIAMHRHHQWISAQHPPHQPRVFQ